MNPGKISLWLDSNEQGSDRAKSLAKAAMEDTRFSLEGFRSQDVDLCFEGDPIHHGHDLLGDVYSENKFLCELKLPSDYISSALGPTGHLADQILTMREAGHPCMVLVLGSDKDVYWAARNSLKPRYPCVGELDFQTGDYINRLRDVEANAFALGVPVFRWKDDPFVRLLSLAHKTLTGGNLYGYRPRPAEGDRELVAASCLFKNIGPLLMSTLLEDYSLMFCPKPGARELEDLPGFGPARAKLVRPKIGVDKSVILCRTAVSGYEDYHPVDYIHESKNSSEFEADVNRVLRSCPVESIKRHEFNGMVRVSYINGYDIQEYIDSELLKIGYKRAEIHSVELNGECLYDDDPNAFTDIFPEDIKQRILKNNELVANRPNRVGIDSRECQLPTPAPRGLHD